MPKHEPVPPLEEQSDLIDRLGGPTKVGKELTRRSGRFVSQQSVTNWRRRGIPFRYRAPMALMAADREVGVPLNFLGEQPAPPPPAPADEAPWLHAE